MAPPSTRSRRASSLPSRATPPASAPNYPVILITSGPLAGQYIYYGHVAGSLVRVGQHVNGGQPIAVMGHAGDAASLGHGHIEIGFSPIGSGDPLNITAARHGHPRATPCAAFWSSCPVAFHIRELITGNPVRGSAGRGLRLVGPGGVRRRAGRKTRGCESPEGGWGGSSCRFRRLALLARPSRARARSVRRQFGC